MGSFKVDKFVEIGNKPIQNGENPIYNILAAYAEEDHEIGYTQGMNFLVGLLYVALGFDESLTFSVFIRIMKDLEWRDIYSN